MNTLNTLPVIHLNGSAKNTLIEDVLSVRRALDTVLDRMAKARPHPRDYPVEGSYSIARIEWGATERAMQDIQDDLENYLTNLVDL